MPSLAQFDDVDDAVVDGDDDDGVAAGHVAGGDGFATGDGGELREKEHIRSRLPPCLRADRERWKLLGLQVDWPRCHLFVGLEDAANLWPGSGIGGCCYCCCESC